VSSVEVLRDALLVDRIRSFFLELMSGDMLHLRLDERWDLLAGECWVGPTFASSGSTARLDALWRWRIECWVWPTFALEFVLSIRRGLVSDTSSSSSEFSLSNCRVFCSLVRGLELVRVFSGQ